MKNSSISTIALSLAAALSLACSANPEPRTVATGASCASLEDADQTLAEIYQPGAVYSAEPIYKRTGRVRAAQASRVMGATLKVRAEEGMSAPYLQRVLACHAASAKAAHPNDPLHPTSGQIASVSVDESQFGYAIQVEAANHRIGKEIMQRAGALKDSKGSVEVEQVAVRSASSRQL